MDKKEENRWMTVFLSATVVCAAVVTVLVLNKEKYLPELYASHEKENHEMHAAGGEARPHEETDEKKADAEPHEEHKEETAHTEKATIKKTGEGRYFLVAGSFLSGERAESHKNLIQQNFSRLSPEILEVRRDDKTYYRVVVLKSDDAAAVRSLREELVAAGYADSWWYAN